MKKYLKSLLALILFIPFMVNAQNVEIKSVKTVETKGYVEEIKKPVFNGLQVDLDLKFYQVNDYIVYLVTISNGDNEDYQLETNLGTNSKYIEYTLDSKDDKGIIKAQSETEVYLIAKYTKEVPTYLMAENKYTETKNIKINLVSDSVPEETSKNSVAPNPNTGNPLVIIITGLIITVICALVLKNSSVGKFTGMVLILGLVLIPTTILALKTIVIDVNSNVLIEKVEPIKFGIFINSPDDVKIYEVLPGTTWEEWLNSDNNTDGIKLSDFRDKEDFYELECNVYYSLFKEGMLDDFTSGRTSASSVAVSDESNPSYTLDDYVADGGVFLDDEIEGDAVYNFSWMNPCTIDN